MAPSLCENCHKRPKFGSHKYCGRTCAAQAAAKPAQSKQLQPQGKARPRNAGHQKGVPGPQKTVQLCIYCGQKPKFSGFDYCGKSCATLASTTQAKLPATQGVPTTKQKTTRPSNAPPNSSPVASPSPKKPHKVPLTNVPIPQDDTSEEDQELGDEEDDGVSTDLDVYPSDSEPESEDQPSGPAVTAPRPSAKHAPRGSKPSGAPRVAPRMCSIPGCGEPSHVDRHGAGSMYCSIKHREEAVKLGLEAACIMCGRYPQSTSDYFCSSACRNQSMTKT